MTVLGAKCGLLATKNYPVCRGEGGQWLDDIRKLRKNIRWSIGGRVLTDIYLCAVMKSVAIASVQSKQENHINISCLKRLPAFQLLADTLTNSVLPSQHLAYHFSGGLLLYNSSLSTPCCLSSPHHLPDKLRYRVSEKACPGSLSSIPTLKPAPLYWIRARGRPAQRRGSTQLKLFFTSLDVSSENIYSKVRHYKEMRCLGR